TLACCDPNSACMKGVCTSCGGLGQICCPGAAPCSGTNTCQSGTCAVRCDTRIVHQYCFTKCFSGSPAPTEPWTATFCAGDDHPDKLLRTPPQGLCLPALMQPCACPSGQRALARWCCEDTKTTFETIGCTQAEADANAKRQFSNCKDWVEGFCPGSP